MGERPGREGAASIAGRLPEALVRSAVHRPATWLASIATLTALLGIGVGRLDRRTDGAAIYPAGDAAIEATAADQRTFSESGQAIVLLTPGGAGAAVASREGLKLLREVHESLRAVPGVQGERLRSLAVLPDPRAGEAIFSGPRILDDIPEGEAAFQDLLERARRNPLVEGAFLSRDGRAAAFYVPLARGADREKVLLDIERRLPALSTGGFELRLVGPAAVEAALGREILADLARLTPIMAGVIAVLFAVALRSPGATLAAMCQVPILLLCVFGGMGWAGVPLTLVTTILPVILLTVSVTDEFHLLDRWRAALLDGGGSPASAFLEAARQVGRPMVITSLTTALGFLSFVSASIAPLRSFGLWTTLGVLLALLLSFTFVPAFLVTLPPSWSRPRFRGRAATGDGRTRADRLALRLGGAGALLGGALVLLALPGLARLRVEDSWIDNLDPRSTLVAAHRTFDRSFWGAYRLDVVLTHPEATFFQHVAGIRVVEEVEAMARAAPGVGGVMSHVDAHRHLAALHGDAGRVSDLPAGQVRERSALLMKVQRHIDLDHVLSRDGRAARVRLFVKDADYARTRELERHLEQALPALLAGTGVEHHFSGDLPVAAAVVRSIVSNMLRSIGGSLLGVALLVGIAMRSARAAAVAVAPLVAAAPVLLGGMGYAGLPLGIATSMFAAVMIGVGVDFAIHILHTYRESRRAGIGHPEAFGEAMRLTSRPIRWNVAALVAGLLVLALSSLAPNRNLGLLLAAAMTTCYLTTLLLLPFLGRVAFASTTRPDPDLSAFPVTSHAPRRS